MSFRCIQNNQECELDSVSCESGHGDPYTFCIDAPAGCQEDSQNPKCQQALNKCQAACDKKVPNDKKSGKDTPNNKKSGGDHHKMKNVWVSPEMFVAYGVIVLLTILLLVKTFSGRRRKR